MNTSHITDDEFRKFLDRNYLFPEEVKKNDEEPIVLEDATYYGAINEHIFRFEARNGEIVSLEEIEPEQIELEHLLNPNSGLTDCLFQNWLSPVAQSNAARRWLVQFCGTTDISALNENHFKAIAEMFEAAKIPWDRYLVEVSTSGKKIESQISCCKFVIAAVKAGILPWDFP